MKLHHNRGFMKLHHNRGFMKLHHNHSSAANTRGSFLPLTNPPPPHTHPWGTGNEIKEAQAMAEVCHVGRLNDRSTQDAPAPRLHWTAPRRHRPLLPCRAPPRCRARGGPWGCGVPGLRHPCCPRAPRGRSHRRGLPPQYGMGILQGRRGVQRPAQKGRGWRRVREGWEAIEGGE
jgi:hypothetical protein